MAESFDERIIQQKIRSYEISIWTLQDRFLSVLKWSTMNQKGQIQEPEVILRDDGTEELSFTIPKFYWVGPDKIPNPMWLHLQDQPLEANMHKLKVIFNKNTEDERVFEFLVTSVASDHTQDRVDINVKAEGLAFHELGKVGYKIALSQTNFELVEKEWINKGMHGDRPRMNIQYWNDLIFKDSNGDWRTNWRYEVRMDWSSYSQATGFQAKDPTKVYEDEYVSSWLLDSNGKLAPRLTEGYKEKWRPVEVSESNIYNATQTIAEQFGVFCRYEYEHNDSYQIVGKKVIYYNNYIQDQEGHIDLTYPYSSSAITRTVDNSNVTTKLFVSNVEQDSQLISIIDTDANKSKEDYLLCFDYLRDIQAINEDQYEELANYEAHMHQYNTALIQIQDRIRVLTNQLIDLEADYTTYTNALALDNERYDEAVKGMNSITGGKQYLPVDTSFVVMEDAENGLGLYIKMRFEGMVPSSIKLYGKSNFASLNGEQYSYPITTFLRRYDDSGDLTHLYNIQGQVGGNALKAGDMIYLQGQRDPYTYYERLAKMWDLRKISDGDKAKKAEDTISLYNWYIYGSRVDYGRVGSARVDEGYYGLAIVAPLDDEEALAAWFATRPFISSYAGQARVGLAGEDEDFTYDHFEKEDIENDTADLIYFQEYYLKAKEIEYNKLERMMGPALREGYWQPDNYHDYGDSYDATFRLTAKKTLLVASDDEPSSFNNFIPESQVWATAQDDGLAPHMQVIWDCNKYYENEEPLVYTSSISENRDQHLTIDVSAYLNKISDHLDDLCFFYSAPSNVQTIEEINGGASGNESGTKMAAVKYNLEQFKKGTYGKGGTNTVGEQYYNKLKYFINGKLISENPETEEHKPFNSYFSVIDTLKAQVNNLITNNHYYTNVSDDELASLEDIANKLKSLETSYATVIKAQTSITNDKKDTTDEYKNAAAAIKFGQAQVAWLSAGYSYLMEIDSLLLADWNKQMGAIDAVDDKHYYSTVDKGLVTFIKQYKTYLSWLESLEKNRYNSFQIKSQAELGWVIDTNPKFDADTKQPLGHDDRTRIPVFIITAANTLDDNTIKFLIEHKYTTTKLWPDGTQIPEEHTVTNEDYWPFLGYYDIKKAEDGTITSMDIVEICKLKTTDYLGINKAETNNYTRVLTSYDYDRNGTTRQPTAAEYRYQRVYPRLFFNTLKLKNTSSDLYINLNNTTLTNFEDYSVVTDDRSKGQKVQGIGYYVTLKPHLLFQFGDASGTNAPKFDISYVLSNADVSIYLDALKVMRENAYPKVSYDVELSVLNPEFVRTAYNRLNQIVHINDNDLQLEEVSGYISSVTLKLDKPWEDTIEIKNYETKFEDLFTTIVAQTEAMKKSSFGLDTALQAFSRTTGLIDSDVLYNSILNANLNLNFNKGKLTIDQNEGIWGTSDDGVVAFRGGGIFTATQKDANGNWMWNTGILPAGINANLITTGQLDTNKIKVYAGDELRFQLNGEGLYAYKSYTSESSDILSFHNVEEDIDNSQYVVFNSDGLFLHAEEGAVHTAGTTIDNSTKLVIQNYAATTQAIDRVEISWKGLILRNWAGEQVFYADPDTGNLFLKGKIEANSGNIAGWEIGPHEISKGGLTLRSGPDIADVGIELHKDGISIDIETGVDVNGNESYFYPYNPVINEQVDDKTIYYLKEGSRVDQTIAAGATYYTPEMHHVSAIPLYQKRETIAKESAPDYSGTTESDDALNLSTNITTTVDTKIYVMLDSELTEYATDTHGDKIEYISGDNALDAAWLTKLSAVNPTHYTDYVVYTDERYFKENTVAAETTLVLRPKGTAEATFFAYANTGDVKILQGQMGNFTISNNALSNGRLKSTVFDADNKFYVGNVEHKFGELIYGLATDAATGEIRLQQVNGKSVNFNIAAMQAYKDAVAAAAKLTLTLNVAGKQYTFTAP